MAGEVPEIDIQQEKRLHELTLQLIGGKHIKSAHDCSEGGLIVTVCESLFGALGKGKQLGARLDIHGDIAPDRYLFGEDQSRMVVSASEGNLAKIQAMGKMHSVDVTVIGKITADGVLSAGDAFQQPVSELMEIYNSSLESIVSAGVGLNPTDGSGG